MAERKVTIFFMGTQPAGEHTARWDGVNQNGVPVSSGIYFLQLTTRELPSPHKESDITAIGGNYEHSDLVQE